MTSEELPLINCFKNREEQAIIFRLRTATGAGIMDCRNAYRENDSDFEAAKQYLIRRPHNKLYK